MSIRRSYVSHEITKKSIKAANYAYMYSFQNVSQMHTKI